MYCIAVTELFSGIRVGPDQGQRLALVRSQNERGPVSFSVGGVRSGTFFCLDGPVYFGVVRCLFFLAQSNLLFFRFSRCDRALEPDNLQEYATGPDRPPDQHQMPCSGPVRSGEKKIGPGPVRCPNSGSSSDGVTFHATATELLVYITVSDGITFCITDGAE